MLPESLLSYLPSTELFAAKRAAKKAQLTVAKLDNVLVAQKDTLIRRINDSEEPEELRNILSHMHFIRGFWEEMNYGYKYAEVVLRVKDRATSLRDIAQKDMTGQRKNCRVMAHLLGRVSTFDSVIAMCCKEIN